MTPQEHREKLPAPLSASISEFETAAELLARSLDLSDSLGESPDSTDPAVLALNDAMALDHVRAQIEHIDIFANRTLKLCDEILSFIEPHTGIRSLPTVTTALSKLLQSLEGLFVICLNEPRLAHQVDPVRRLRSQASRLLKVHNT